MHFKIVGKFDFLSIPDSKIEWYSYFLFKV